MFFSRPCLSTFFIKRREEKVTRGRAPEQRSIEFCYYFLQARQRENIDSEIRAKVNGHDHATILVCERTIAPGSSWPLCQPKYTGACYLTWTWHPRSQFHSQLNCEIWQNLAKQNRWWVMSLIVSTWSSHISCTIGAHTSFHRRWIRPWPHLLDPAERIQPLWPTAINTGASTMAV